MSRQVSAAIAKFLATKSHASDDHDAGRSRLPLPISRPSIIQHQQYATAASTIMALPIAPTRDVTGINT
jgi:hypothetical protein